MKILRVKQPDGTIVDVPFGVGAKGKDGKSAYEYAQDGGYTGTEAEFVVDINPDNIKTEATPELGVDYFTENDKNNIVSQVYEMIKNGGVVGFIDDANNIVLTGNVANGAYNIKYEMDDGSTIDIGNLTLGNDVYYSITNNLTNCTSNNSITSVTEGGSYSATISANDGYILSSIAVTMGGVDVTSSVVSDGNIDIASVTGDVVITAVAEKMVVKTNFFKATPTASTTAAAKEDTMVLGGRLGSDLGYRADGGPDCLLSNYIPVQNGDEVYVTNLEISSSLYSGLFTVVGDTKATAIFNSSNGNGNVTNVSANGFTISNASVSYVRICGKPSNSIKVNSSGATVDEKYDCSQIAVNVKRNGAWL